MKHHRGQILSVLCSVFGVTAVIVGLASPTPAVCVDSVKVLFQFYGPDTSSRVGNYINGLGDINGDGYPDIAVSSESPKGTYIFYGGPNATSTPAMFVRGSAGPPTRIDINGDGIPDLVTTEWRPAGFLYSAATMYFYRGYPDSLASTPYDSFSLATNNYGLGGSFQYSFVDTDKYPALLTIQEPTPTGPIVYYVHDFPTLNTTPDWTYALTNRRSYISTFGFIDWNGDGHVDIFIGVPADTASSGYVYIFYGPNYGSTPDIIIAPPDGFDSLGGTQGKKAFAQGVFNVGDYDGDGWDDLGVLYNDYPFIFRGGPGADTLYDFRLQSFAVSMCRAGDINGDGKADVIAGDSRAGWGGIDVFLGGSKADSVSDFCFTDVALPPKSLDYIGWRVARVGDFDGDGLDDILFSCKNLGPEMNGAALIVAGSTDIKTDVAEPIRAQIPSKFVLHPAYPNPFNPSTTISFDLPKREAVKVTVFDVTGRVVRTLLDMQLSAGSHRVTWDGKNEAGHPVASGVYLFRLSTPDYRQTVKGTLLK